MAWVSEDYFLGVDSGNSKTVALVARADGRVVGWGRGGGGDIYVSEAEAVAAVTEAVAGALAAAGISASALTASCLSLVGADWPEDFAFWRLEAQKRGFARVLVVNDALGALRAGTAGDGVAVVCGTGAAIGARRAGVVWHSSFWQEPMGGAALGERTLRAVYRAELGLGPATLLTDKVLAHFDLPTVEAVLHRLTARRTRGLTVPPTGLTRLLLDAAAEGDEPARREVVSAAVTLGEYAWVAACKVGLQTPFPLVLAGGVLRHPSPLLREAVITHLQTRLPHARPVMAPFEPVVGRLLLLALEAAPGTSLPDTEGLAERLAATLPEAAFFST